MENKVETMKRVDYQDGFYGYEDDTNVIKPTEKLLDTLNKLHVWNDKVINTIKKYNKER